MPFKSQAQRRLFYATMPEKAKEWEAHTPKGKKLPARVHKKQAYEQGFRDALVKLATDWMMPGAIPNPLLSPPEGSNSAFGLMPMLVNEVTGAQAARTMTQIIRDPMLSREERHQLLAQIQGKLPDHGLPLSPGGQSALDEYLAAKRGGPRLSLMQALMQLSMAAAGRLVGPYQATDFRPAPEDERYSRWKDSPF